MGARSATVVVRLKPEGLGRIDTLAREAGVRRSEMVRRLLSEAIVARDRRA